MCGGKDEYEPFRWLPPILKPMLIWLLSTVTRSYLHVFPTVHIESWSHHWRTSRQTLRRWPAPTKKTKSAKNEIQVFLLHTVHPDTRLECLDFGCIIYRWTAKKQLIIKKKKPHWKEGLFFPTKIEVNKVETFCLSEKHLFKGLYVSKTVSIHDLFYLLMLLTQNPSWEHVQIKTSLGCQEREFVLESIFTVSVLMLWDREMSQNSI